MPNWPELPSLSPVALSGRADDLTGTLPAGVLPPIPALDLSVLAAIAFSGSASDLIAGTVPLARLPVIPASDISGLAPSATTDTTNAANIAGGILAVARGGTGLGAYTIGDLIYASGAAALSKLADVAVGQVLVSGGVGAAPTYSANPQVSTLVGTYNSGFIRQNNSTGTPITILNLGTSTNILQLGTNATGLTQIELAVTTIVDGDVNIGGLAKTNNGFRAWNNNSGGLYGKDTGGTDRSLAFLDASNVLQIGASTGIASAHINNSTQIDSLGVGIAASGVSGRIDLGAANGPIIIGNRASLGRIELFVDGSAYSKGVYFDTNGNATFLQSISVVNATTLYQGLNVTGSVLLNTNNSSALQVADTGAIARNALKLDSANVLQIGAATGIASININNSTRVTSLGVGVAADGTLGDILLPNASAIKQLDSGAVARNLIGLDGSNNTNVGNPAIGGTIINGASTVNGPLGINSILTLNTNTLGLKQKDSGGTARFTLNLDASNILQVGGTGVTSITLNNVTQFGTALISLGGGAAPTLGTIGGSGPAVAAQNSWLKVKDSTGADAFIPIWK